MKSSSVMGNLGSSVGHSRNLILRWLLPGEVSTASNHWNLYRDIAWYGVLSGVSQTFTTVFALRLGASNLTVGLLTSLPALINIFFQIPAARLIERERERRRILLVSGLFMRLPVFLVALVPFLRAWRAEAVVYVTALGTIPAAVSNVAFTAMLAEVVAPRDRARVVSVRNALLSAVTMVTVLASGRALDILVFPVNYQLIFTLAFLTSLLSLYYLGRVAMPHTEPLPAAVASGRRLDLRQWLHTLLARRDYLRFGLGAFVYHWGLYLPLPLYSIYRVRELGISEGWIGALATVESAITIVAYYVWGKIAARRGSRSVLLFGILGVSFYPLGTALCRSVTPLLLVVSISGIFSPAWTLGLFNGLLEVVPTERRATYVAVFNTLMNVPAFIAPLLGTTLAGMVGTRNALFVGAAARAIGFVVFAGLLRYSVPPVGGSPLVSSKGRKPAA
jgi:MFS family permease